MSIRGKLVLVPIILLVIGFLFYFFLHSAWVKKWIVSYAENYLQENYGLHADFDSLDYRLSPLSIELRDIHIYGGRDNTQTFLSADRIVVQASTSLLWSTDTVIDRIALENPKVHVQNLPQLKEREKKTADGGRLRIKEIRITQGNVAYANRQVQKVDVQASVTNDALIISHLKATYSGVELWADGRLENFDNPHYSARYQIYGDAAIVQDLYPKAPLLKGSLSGAGTAQGGMDHYKVEGTLDAESLCVEDGSPFQLHVAYWIDSKNKQTPYRWRARWNGIPFAAFRNFVQGIPPLSTRSNGSLSYEGGADFWAGQGGFETELIPSVDPGVPVRGKIAGQLKDSVIRLFPGALSLYRSTLRFDGTVSRSGIRMDVKANVPDVSDFSAFSSNLRGLPGSYQVEAHLTGPFNNILIASSVEGTARDLRLHVSGQYFTGNKYVSAQYQLSGSAQAVRYFVDIAATGDIRTEGAIHGVLYHPQWEGTFHTGNLTLKNVRLGSVEGRYSSDGRQFYLNASLADLATAARVSYGLLTRNVTVSVDMKDTSVETLRPLLPSDWQEWQGNITAELRAKGDASHWKSAEASLEIRKASLTRGNRRIDLQPNSMVRVSHQTIRVDLHALMDQKPLDLTGSVSFRGAREMDLAVSGQTDLSFLSLFQPGLQAKGVLLLDIRIYGSLSNPLVTGSLSSELLHFSYPDKKVELSQAKLAANFLGPSVEIHASGLLDHISPQIQVHGPLSFSGQVTGPLSEPVITGEVVSESFTLSVPDKNVQLAQGNFRLNVVRGVVEAQMTGLLNQASIKLEALLPVDIRRGKMFSGLRTAEGEVTLMVDSFPLASVFPDSNISGLVHVKAVLRGRGTDLSAWQGNISITPESLRISDTPLTSNGPIRVDMANGKVLLRPLEIKAGQWIDLRAEGQMDRQSGRISGNVTASAELSLISQFLPDVSASGPVNGTIRVSGTITDPDLSGNLTVEKGTFRIPDFPILISNLQMQTSIQGDSIFLTRLTGEMGGGTIQGGGSLQLVHWWPSKIDLWFRGRNVGLNYPQNLRSQVSSDLTLKTEDGNFVLGGEVQLVRSVFEEDIDYRDRLVNNLLSGKRNLAQDRAFASRLRLDIRVRTVEDLGLRNNLARLRASADLHVGGNASLPRLRGSLRIREGSQLYFEGNLFEVNRGIINFYGTHRIRPVFDVELYTLVHATDNNIDYEITLPIRGPIDDLEELQPTSVPFLDENQIYYLLMTGRANARLGEATTQFAQRQIVGYFTGQLFFDVQQKLVGALGLTRVEIQPELISSETDPGAKIIIGKDFTSSFSILYSSSLNNSEDRTWIANYRIKRNLSWRWIDQEEGSYTTSLKHSLRFGPGTSWKELQQREKFRLEKPKVGTLQMENHTRIPDNQMREMIEIQTGAPYDFWGLQDGMDRVKSRLQEMGYLFPAATVRETSRDRTIDLDIKIEDRGLRRMVFSGRPVSKKHIEKYNKWWREGYSEEAIVGLIRDDLMRSLWLEGFHRAEVFVRKEKTDATVNYVFELNTGPVFHQAEILYQGAQHFTEEELRRQLKNLYESEQQMISDAIHNFHTFSDRIAALYVQRGFLDTRVESGPTTYRNGTVQKTIIIQEGSPSRIVEVVVYPQEFPPELRQRLKLKEGSIYDPDLLHEDELTISTYYEERGYLNFDIETEITRVRSSSDLILHYSLTMGGVARVGEIVITGNRTTDRKTIEQRLPFRVGDVLTQDRILEAQKNLGDLRLFHQIRMDAEKTDVPDQYRVVIDVMEMQRYELEYGIRYDTRTRLGGEFRIQDLNLLGTGRSLALIVRRASNPRETLEPSRQQDLPQLFRVIYSSPAPKQALPSLRWGTLASASYQEGEFETFFARRWDLSIQRQMKLFGPFFYLPSYRFRRFYNRALNPTTPVPAFTLKTSRLIQTVLADTRDDPINATRGSFFSSEIEYAPEFLGSDLVFIRNWNQFFYYRSFGDSVWASGLRLGLASAFDSFLIGEERFFAGGSDTMRGFRFNEVGPISIATGQPRGGEAVIIINQELRFPIYRWLRGVIFYDGGNVYNQWQDFNLSDIRHSLGFGLRLDTPFGLGRIDLGINLDPRKLVIPDFEEPRYVMHFGIGQAF